MVTVAEICDVLEEGGFKKDDAYRVGSPISVKLSKEVIIHVKIPDREGVNILLKPKHQGFKKYLMNLRKAWSGDLLYEECEGVSVVPGKSIPYSGRYKDVDTKAGFFLAPEFIRKSLDSGYSEKGIHYNDALNIASYNWGKDLFDPSKLKETICKVAY